MDSKKSSTATKNKKNEGKENDEFKQIFGKIDFLMEQKTKGKPNAYNLSPSPSAHQNSMVNGKEQMVSKMDTSNKSTKPRPTKTGNEFLDIQLLNSFMNEDESKDPKNLHLLTDNDTNQSVTAAEKFRNLAKLMLDDKDIVAENSFEKSDGSKMTLSLYTSLSRNSKKLFVEDDPDKVSRLQLFFQRINNYSLPNFKESDLPDHNSYDLITAGRIEYEGNQNNLQNSEGSLASDLNSSGQLNDSNNGLKKIGTLSKTNKKNISGTIVDDKKPSMDESAFYSKDTIDKFFEMEPKINCDILTYINHNIITIEDIYNQQRKVKIERKEEEMIKPTSEVINLNNEEAKMGELTGTKKNKKDMVNLFNYFKEVSDNGNFKVDSDNNFGSQQNKINDECKRHDDNLKFIGKLNKTYYPQLTEKLKKKPELIYQIALWNQRLMKEDISNRCFSKENGEDLDIDLGEDTDTDYIL